MPPRKNQPSGPTPVEAFKHEDKRVNIPTADSSELVSPDVAQPTQLRYPRNPDLDPQLVWTGKDAQDGEDLVVDAPPIYIQEKIVPQVIIENLRKAVEDPQLTLFADFDGLGGYEAVEYYQHGANWSNRMILGDSLQVMASLAEKENLRGKVQMVYIDPPYGIKFGSNWQARTDKRSVADGKVEDVTREVEVIKAFRDTWELGIHSYLAYLRDRILVAHDLLTESGSVFVQIGEQNVHLVRSILDETFGAENSVSLITFVKTGMQTDQLLANPCDYILWYAKDRDKVKFRRLFLQKSFTTAGGSEYNKALMPDGSVRNMTLDEMAMPQLLPVGAKIFRYTTLTSQRPPGDYPVEINGRTYRPGSRFWTTHEDGMRRLICAKRVAVQKNALAYIRYLDDFPVFPLNSNWVDTAIAGRPGDKFYVVQTSPKVIERCVLMATDPGDLIIDPTCGSGTTAVVSEQWGRRWITIDSSRVALALARQRIMGMQFPYYNLADTDGDIRKGFVYRKVPHVTLKSIANNPDIKPGMSRTEIDAAIVAIQQASEACCGTGLFLLVIRLAWVRCRPASRGCR